MAIVSVLIAALANVFGGFQVAMSGSCIIFSAVLLVSTECDASLLCAMDFRNYHENQECCSRIHAM